MTTASKSRKRVKPARRVSIGTPCNGVYAVHMTIGEGEKVKHYGYYIVPIPAGFGMGFQVEKFDAEKVEGEDSICHVNIDQRGHSTCDCKGGTYCGHCKHQEATAALLKAGKLTPAAKPQPAPVASQDNDFDDP